MREIKFRAWYGAKIWNVNEITFANSLDFVANYGTRSRGIVLCTDDSGHRLTASLGAGDMTLMQYTGLNDKNGVEIYEGDIVKILVRDWASCSGCHKSAQEHMDAVAKRLVVVFKDGEFCMEKPGYYNDSFNSGGVKDIFEVIGNVHENPELLQ